MSKEKNMNNLNQKTRWVNEETGEEMCNCIICDKEFLQDRDLQICDNCIDNYDTDKAWKDHDNNKIDILDLNENETLLNKYKKSKEKIIFRKVENKEYSFYEIRKLDPCYPLQARAGHCPNQHERGLDEECEEGGKHEWLLLPFKEGHKQYLQCLKCWRHSHL